MIAASNDKACDVIGAGCLTPDPACISFGTTATINTQNAKYVELRRLMPPFPSAVPGQFYTEVGVMRGLWMVSWFKEEFGLQERLQAQEGERRRRSCFDELAARRAPRRDGPRCSSPTGPRGPNSPRPPRARSSASVTCTRGRISIARSSRGWSSRSRKGPNSPRERTAVPIAACVPPAAGSQSDAILQITADVFGLPVVRPHTHETSVLGAAMDAAVGLKRFSDFDTQWRR